MAPNIAQLQAQIAALVSELNLAEDVLAALQNSGIPASNVPVAETDSFPEGTTAQEALELLDSLIEALASATETALGQVEPPQLVRTVTVNTELAAGRAYRLRNTGITLTLPAAPVANATIRITDGEVLSATATVALARNGQTIMGLPENLTLDLGGVDLLLWFNGVTWRLF
ncbi:MAG: hypothetical protein KIS86_04715 [Devosia sp.]|nr:hypothetical protein [Devosia sp.]